VKCLLDAGALDADVEVKYSYGTPSMCDLLFERGHLWKKNSVQACIIAGNLEVLNWLIERKAELVPRDARCAAAHGNRNVLELYWDTFKVFPEDILEYAVQSDNCRVVNWVMKKGYSFADLCIKEAVKSDSLGVLKWLQETNLDRDVKEEAEEYLTGSNSLRMLRWVLNDAFSDDDISMAFESCSFGIIEFMYKQSFNPEIIRKIEKWISFNEGEKRNLWLSLREICLDAYSKRK